MSQVELLVFPHQIFAEHPGLQDGIDSVALVEDNLMFGGPRHIGVTILRRKATPCLRRKMSTLLRWQVSIFLQTELLAHTVTWPRQW